MRCFSLHSVDIVFQSNVRPSLVLVNLYSSWLTTSSIEHWFVIMVYKIGVRAIWTFPEKAWNKDVWSYIVINFLLNCITLTEHLSILVCSRLCWPIVLVSVIYVLAKIRMRWSVLTHDIRIGPIFAAICTLDPSLSSSYICSQIEICRILCITIQSQIMLCPITDMSKTR